MKKFDILVVGGGVAGVTFAYLAQRAGFKTLLLEKRGRLLEGASGVAGAFLFPKVGLDTPYTRFINRGILEGLDFWEKLGVEVDRAGVLILPRDKKDVEKFNRYRQEIKLPFEEREGGFYFPDGGVVDVAGVRKVMERELNWEGEKEAKVLERVEEGWVVNGSYFGKRVVLAEGAEGNFLPKYCQIYPIWGERVALQTPLTPPYHYHKQVSISRNREGIVKIGATHKRNCLNCRENWEEVEELLKKAEEIFPIQGEVVEIKGGFRASSRDFFPVVGEVIDLEKSIERDPQLLKGQPPRRGVVYRKNLYILNGMGARGFSNGVTTAQYLLGLITGERIPDPHLSPLRHFLRYIRKLWKR